MSSWTDKLTLSRTLKIWSILFVLFIVSCTAELTGEDLKNIEALNVQKMLQHQIKGDAKDQIRKGKRIFVNETTPDERNVHPYMRKGIIREVLQFYSKYREMIFVRGGTFWRGTNDPQSKTGEYPLRKVTVKNFYLDANPVINAAYWAFRKAKKFFITDAEKKGWSWVVDMFLSDETREYYSMPGTRGWAAVKNADWNAPEGPDSNLEDRWNHPVVHVSWYDAKMFCEFHGKRLPSEAEWEYAVKIGVTSHAYPWGDNWERRRANVWQGKWPTENKKIDGYSITSPVDAYRPQNLVGFYDMIGNVWEWTSSAYVERSVQPHSKMVVLKGGSYVDSVSGEINYPVRNGQRIGQKQDYTAANVGFRCAKTMPEYVPLPQATESPVVQKLKKMKRRKFHRRRKDEL